MSGVPGAVPVVGATGSAVRLAVEEALAAGSAVRARTRSADAAFPADVRADLDAARTRRA